MMKPIRLLLLLLLCAWGFPATASAHAHGIGPIPLASSLEPQLRTAGEDCAYRESHCHCSTAASADFIAAPERRDPSADAALAACMEVQPWAYIPASGVAAMFAAEATAPGSKRPLYLLHLNLRR